MSNCNCWQFNVTQNCQPDENDVIKTSPTSKGNLAVTIFNYAMFLEWIEGHILLALTYQYKYQFQALN